MPWKENHLRVICACVAVSGCGSTSAMQPDSRNPAHCVVAFTLIRNQTLSFHPPALNLAVQMTARSIFEGKRLKDAGALETGEAESQKLLDAIKSDQHAVDALLTECMNREDKDPAYRALNESGELIKAAKMADPACQGDAICKASTK